MTAASAASVAVTHRASLEPLFADDCADFPLLPGVSVLEYARTTAEAHLPAEGLRLRAVDRVRFTGVAFPGEELTVELEWTPVGEDEWACVAVVSTGRGKASSARLRYVGGGRPVIELDGVRRLLAPRRPMTLVDRVLEVVPGERIVAVKAVTGNEPWYARMPEDTPAEQLAYPPTLLIESWGQAAGILADLSHEGPKGVLLLAGAADVEFHRPVLPGVLLKHRVRLVRIVRELVGFEGEILVDGEAVASIGQLTMAYRPDDVLRQSGPTAPAATTATDRPGEPAA